MSIGHDTYDQFLFKKPKTGIQFLHDRNGFLKNIVIN
jgi:hypothetical protein